MQIESQSTQVIMYISGSHSDAAVLVQSKLWQLQKECVDIEHRNHNAKRSVKGWMKKFTRMKAKYTAFVTKIGASGSSAGDYDLFNTPPLPPFYKEMYEVENRKGWHDPPSLPPTSHCATDDHEEGVSTSVRKRQRLRQTRMVEE